MVTAFVCVIVSGLLYLAVSAALVVRAVGSFFESNEACE
jgi:hypothetical protein